MNAFDLRAQYGGFSLEAVASWNEPYTAIFGASGSGKTTILESIAGFRADVRGTIVLRDRSLESLPSRDRRLGWVPQDASLFPHLTARENIAFAARARGSPTSSDVAIDALEIAGLLDRPAARLSGGERQRVAIARALASSPDFLLLDEPLASIDRPLRTRILPFLQRLPDRTGVPILLVTHDPLEVVALATHVIVLESGRVVAQGEPRSVFASAATFGTLHALGAENVFDVRVLSRGPGRLRLETTNGCELEMAAVAGFGEPRRVAVRSEEILLSTDPPGRVSAQNVLVGIVEAIEPAGVRIQSGGERWIAKLTARAIERLALEPGATVHLLIKAHAILPCE